MKKLRQWLKDLPKPAAIMAVTDIRAAEIINICRDEGISVPEQVSIIGADHDTSLHEKCGMAISSVSVNEQLLGRYAVRELEFLFRHPKWKGRPHEIVVPAGDLFVGESTVQSSSAAHLVKAAHDFITERLNRKITPSDVIAHLGCSRSLAELRFSQIEGKTIRKAIEDARLNEVQRRLANRETVRSIVKSMQFTSANQLYRIYKRHFGHTIMQETSKKP
jgi:LacI family transcriptional regulator